MNKVHKIIYRDNEITFVIKTDDIDHFWWWSVTKEEAKPYFDMIDALPNMNTEHLTDEQAFSFVNYPRNKTLGISCGPYESVEEIVNEQAKWEVITNGI